MEVALAVHTKGAAYRMAEQVEAAETEMLHHVLDVADCLVPAFAGADRG